MVNLCIWLTISSCYGLITLTCGLKASHGDLITALSQLPVSLSAEGAKNLPGPWLSLFQRWGSQTMPLRAKFIYTGLHLILLQFNPFDNGVDREGWWFEHPCVIVVGFHVSRGC